MPDLNKLTEQECEKLFPDYSSKQWDKIGADFHVKGGQLNLTPEQIERNSKSCSDLPKGIGPHRMKL